MSFLSLEYELPGIESPAGSPLGTTCNFCLYLRPGMGWIGGPQDSWGGSCSGPSCSWRRTSRGRSCGASLSSRVWAYSGGWSRNSGVRRRTCWCRSPSSSSTTSSCSSWSSGGSSSAGGRARFCPARGMTSLRYGSPGTGTGVGVGWKREERKGQPAGSTQPSGSNPSLQLAASIPAFIHSFSISLLTASSSLSAVAGAGDRWGRLGPSLSRRKSPWGPVGL